MKAVKGSWVARMGRNFDDYPGVQPKRSWANTYAQDCSKLIKLFQEFHMQRGFPEKRVIDI